MSIPKIITKLWRFSSSSSDKLYETLQYSDGSVSCDCFGWTKRVKNGVRTCKHTRSVLSGMADQECKTSSNLQPDHPQMGQQWRPLPSSPTKKAFATFGHTGRKVS